jgi:hypothetical protein
MAKRDSEWWAEGQDRLFNKLVRRRALTSLPANYHPDILRNTLKSTLKSDGELLIDAAMAMFWLKRTRANFIRRLGQIPPASPFHGKPPKALASKVWEWDEQWDRQDLAHGVPINDWPHGLSGIMGFGEWMEVDQPWLAIGTNMLGHAEIMSWPTDAVAHAIKQGAILIHRPLVEALASDWADPSQRDLWLLLIEPATEER